MLAMLSPSNATYCRSIPTIPEILNICTVLFGLAKTSCTPADRLEQVAWGNIRIWTYSAAAYGRSPGFAEDARVYVAEIVAAYVDGANRS